jgi:hypothetical protein
MEWATIWSWTVTILQWCFYAAVIWFAVKWWARSMANDAKIRFIEAKIDALLEHFEVGYNEAFREHIAQVLREHGERAAKTKYVLTTGDSLSEADCLVQELSHAEEENPEIGSPHGPLGADELHELVDQAFREPHRKPRRRRR